MRMIAGHEAVVSALMTPAGRLNSALLADRVGRGNRGGNFDVNHVGKAGVTNACAVSYWLQARIEALGSLGKAK